MNTPKIIEKGTAISGTIVSAVKTPRCPLRFSNLVNPYYYNNSLNIPRYSITVIMCPKANGEFINQLSDIQKREGALPVFKEETQKDLETGNLIATGNVLIKFQSRIPPPVKKMGENGLEDVTLTEELPFTTQVEVTFDALRFTNLQTRQKGISLKPTLIIIYPTASETPTT